MAAPGSAPAPPPPLAPRRSAPLCPAADVAEPSAVTAAVKVVEEKLRGLGLNLLINNAAVYSSMASLDTVDAEDMIRTYRTNTVGPMLMAQVWMKLRGWNSPRRGNLPQNIYGLAGDCGELCQGSQS